MAKFKVGDKVRVKRDLNGCFGVSLTMEKNRGRTVTIAHCDGTSMMQYKICEDDKNLWWDESMFEPVEKREFIVIQRDGAKTIAELRHDREVIKSGTAICNASDTFDFGTGAKLAFDRLMGQQNIDEAVKAWNKPSHAPEPPKFYTGSVRCTGCTPIATFAYEGWIGKIITFKDGYSNFYGKDNNKYRFTSFEDFCKKNNQGTFAEVKPDVR